MNNALLHQNENKILMYYLGMPVQLPPELEDFRKKFDPKYKVNEAHATLVAPFSATLMTPELDEHFAYVISQFKQQTIIASDYYITPHGYIFYTFDNSSAQILSEQYDYLHQYPLLVQHKKGGHSFLPHITIGKFESEKEVPLMVRETLPKMCAQQSMLFDRVRLYGILDEPKKRAHVKDYILSGNDKEAACAKN